MSLLDQVTNFTTTIHHDTYPAISASNHLGHAIFVTGASRGIGRATVLSFARAGASAIAIAARGKLDVMESEILETAKAAGHPVPQVLKLVLDVSNEAAVRDAVAKVKTQFGRLDILINNAGRIENILPLADGHPEDWWKTWEVNLKGVYLVTHAFLPLLLRGGQKTIINISSIGSIMASPGLSAYQTSKLALLRLADFVMTEYGDQGILTFCVHPGGVATELVGEILPSWRHMFIDSPELCGDTISWLSEERQRGDTFGGRLLCVNWDMPELINRREEIVQGNKLRMTLVV